MPHLILVLQAVDHSDDRDSSLADNLRDQIIVHAQIFSVFWCADTIDKEVDVLAFLGESLHTSVNAAKGILHSYGSILPFVETRRIPYSVRSVSFSHCNPVATSVRCATHHFARYDGQVLSGVAQHFDQWTFAYAGFSKNKDIIDLAELAVRIRLVWRPVQRIDLELGGDLMGRGFSEGIVYNWFVMRRRDMTVGRRVLGMGVDLADRSVWIVKVFLVMGRVGRAARRMRRTVGKIIRAGGIDLGIGCLN